MNTPELLDRQSPADLDAERAPKGNQNVRTSGYPFFEPGG